MVEAQEREAMSRVPQTGIFNAVTIPVISSVTFGFIGYHLGKWIGKLGDAKSSGTLQGRFETGLKYIGMTGFGLLAASVAIRQTREANKQAVELAKRSMELEQHNAALASVVTKPIGTLIETFDKAPELSSAGTPLVDVEHAEHAGTVAAVPEKQIA